MLLQKYWIVTYALAYLLQIIVSFGQVHENHQILGIRDPIVGSLILLPTSYSQYFIFSMAYEWAQQDRVLQYSRQESLAREKHTSFLGPFLIFEEKRWVMNTSPEA
jgi:hypothetical protein